MFYTTDKNEKIYSYCQNQFTLGADQSGRGLGSHPLGPLPLYAVPVSDSVYVLLLAHACIYLYV